MNQVFVANRSIYF